MFDKRKRVCGLDELVIENLRPETEYVFYVRAKNDVGVGERAETKATTTAISQLQLTLFIINTLHCDVFDTLM